MPVIRRRRGKEGRPKRQQRPEKSVFDLCVIETVDTDIVELGNRGRTMPKTMNDARDAAESGSDMEKEQIVG